VHATGVRAGPRRSRGPLPKAFEFAPFVRRQDLTDRLITQIEVFPIPVEPGIGFRRLAVGAGIQVTQRRDGQAFSGSAIGADGKLAVELCRRHTGGADPANGTAIEIDQSNVFIAARCEIVLVFPESCTFFQGNITHTQPLCQRLGLFELVLVVAEQ